MMLKLFRRFLRSQLAIIKAEDNSTVDAIVSQALLAAAELGHVPLEYYSHIEPSVRQRVQEQRAGERIH